jgi:hypothetical protein
MPTTIDDEVLAGHVPLAPQANHRYVRSSGSYYWSMPQFRATFVLLVKQAMKMVSSEVTLTRRSMYWKW